MTETSIQMLEAEIEAARTAEGYQGMNNFRAYMPGGYRYNVLQEDPDFGNKKSPDMLKGLSLREFVEYTNGLIEQLGIDRSRIEELQQRCIETQRREDMQALNDYIFPIFKQLRLEGFSHKDCTA